MIGYHTIRNNISKQEVTPLENQHLKNCQAENKIIPETNFSGYELITKLYIKIFTIANKKFTVREILVIAQLSPKI